MDIARLSDAEKLINAIDVVEELLSDHHFVFERVEDAILLAQADAESQQYPMQFLWRPDENALIFTCEYAISLAGVNREKLAEMLATVNNALWTGAFAFAEDEQLLYFRNCLLLGDTVPQPQQVRDLIEIGIATAEKFYPSFSMLCAGHADAGDAMHLSTMACAGHA